MNNHNKQEYLYITESTYIENLSQRLKQKHHMNNSSKIDKAYKLEIENEIKLIKENLHEIEEKS